MKMLKYVPGKERIHVNHHGNLVLNSYHEFKPDHPGAEAVTRANEVLDRHLEHLIVDPEHRQLIKDWMAHQVQNTGQLIEWLPFIMGCRGDGKSILFQIVECSVGKGNAKIVNKGIGSDFQDWAVGSAVTCFEELVVDAKQSKSVANSLKVYITQSTIPINSKGEKETNVPNHTNYIAFSNEDDGISIAHGDRRWFVLHTRFFWS